MKLSDFSCFHAVASAEGRNEKDVAFNKFVWLYFEKTQKQTQKKKKKRKKKNAEGTKTTWYCKMNILFDNPSVECDSSAGTTNKSYSLCKDH